MTKTNSISKRKIIFFTGAGMSAESGISTFRDSDGLWAKHRIEDVCTPEALLNNRKQLIEFYNLRRKELLTTKPNAGHYAIAKFQQNEKFNVEVVTQNIDNLHEQAGSTKVTHLHGELMKLRSSKNPNALIDIEGWEQPLDKKHTDGSLLRPHVVFFGEEVPMLNTAIEIFETADILVVVGTSLAVYPVASLLYYIPNNAVIYIIDPVAPNIHNIPNKINHIKSTAAVGLPLLIEKLEEES